MKIEQTLASRTTLLALVAVFLSGCMTDSSRKVVTLNIKPQSDIVIHVMPTSVAQKRFAVSDAWIRGLVGVLVDQGTGIYTYKFDDKDYAHLRQSVIESLQKGRFFSAVHDVTSDAVEGKGTRLYMKFDESGIQEGLVFYCILKAHVWTEDEKGNLLVKKEVIVREKGLATLSGAKNNAIERFVQEVGSLFPSN